ncbi:P-loop containing nucleoside triphosphate hydrolase protein [Hypoxylon cercidicola]|nr:P-loop containing nucleoside triphosphate hydrolase protein [Hypoxylon cercidicola]
MAPSGVSQSFGYKLPQFFQAGYKLVQGELDMLQRTVTELATEQGALAIRELIDERVMYCRTDRDRISLWRNCIRPFFQMLTEPRVARSAILEVHTGTIYNVVLGSNASRLEMLFNFLIDLAARWDTESHLSDEKEPKCEFLEICTQILVKAIDSNTKNLASEVVPQIVSGMRQSIEGLGGDDRNFWSLQATKHLEYIQRRLGAAKQVGGAPRPPAQEHATFSLRRDLPGKLSPDGPRHDNDSDDITEIRILPTMSEIMSNRSDYRPVYDLTQLHLSGIQGLIDRHFRLLRENMVGPLKEYVSEELKVLETAPSDRINIPKHQSGISDITYTRRAGLDKLSNEAREDWWDMSRRLETGALVCFLQKGTAVFCVVSESTKRPNPARKTSKSKEQVSEKRNLYSSRDFTYVSLNLAEPTDADLGLLLRTIHLNRSVQQSLVEFPGVLLPSFKHTLSALQSIFKSLDLPFTEFLAPSLDRLTDDTIPLPLYAAKPRFTYNLKCITSDGMDLMFSPRDEPNPEELCHRSSLDFGQATALLNALRRSLALIQGPPGTGKSYTGEAIIKVLLANKKKAKTGPILCVCYTNHALDQLLEHLWHGGVKQIIRIGSRSKSSILTDLNIRNIGKDVDRTRSEKKSSWQTATTLTQAEVAMKNYLTGLRSTTIAQRVKENIKTQAPQFYDAIFGTEGDGWTTVTRKDEHALLTHWISAGSLSESSPRDINVLQEEDPETLSQNERNLMCTIWGSEVVTSLEDEFISLHDDYQEAKKGHMAVVREVDLRVLEQADIIGVTTTGLAKDLDLLRHLDSKILICEEAGEVLESHILTALLPSIEHAILIGDHLQLRPQIANYELSVANPRGEKYSLDVSLFERLVQPARPTDLEVPFDTLEIQRRMHPSISNLIRDTLYNSLQDAENVKGYPEVIGMRKRLFWFEHERPESGSDPNNPISTSRTNDFEVEMVCALVSHLVRQGAYGRDDIAVLTPYLGQLQKLRRKLQNSFEIVVDDRDLEELHKEGLDTAPQVCKQALGKCLRLATVDNFQGEEAKVVVISLVRSNRDRQCGFLKTENRINVLLSRAKHGMYIFGNSATYGSVEMWSDVVAMLKHSGNFGTKLPLQCPRHEGKSIDISEPDDFVRLSPEAGCDAQCSLLLDCGHACLSKCHAAPLHKVAKCLAPCPRLKKMCGHSCPKLCGEPCEETCSTILQGQELTLPCGHSLISPRCWETKNPHLVMCRELVEKTVPGCNHRTNVACWEVITNASVCPAICGEPLPCGHKCRGACKTCKIRVDGEIKRKIHGPCTSICGSKYDTCKHHCIRGCHPGESCPPCDLPCEVECPHSRCFKKCSEPCNPCEKTICASSCPHSTCTMPCAAPCNWIPCSKRCYKVLLCGHQCPSLCGELCPNEEFCQTCASPEVKAKVVDISGMKQYCEINLDEEPCVFMRCGHFMTASSMDDQLGMSDYYEIANDGALVAVKTSSKPFSDACLKVCPHCGGSLRDIGRYGRVVRQAVLDYSTKDFVKRYHAQWAELEQRVVGEQERLNHAEEPVQLLVLVAKPGDLHIKGAPLDQLIAINDWVGGDRYLPMIKLYSTISDYLRRVKSEEESFQRVYNQVQHVGGENRQSNVDLAILRTRGQLLARIVRFRCYLAALDDFLHLRYRAKECLTIMHFHLDEAVDECENIIMLAQIAKYASQEIEGRVFYTKIIAMSLLANDTVRTTVGGRANIAEDFDITDDRGLPDTVRKAKSHIFEAELLMHRYEPDGAAWVEFEAAVKMLYDRATYYGHPRGKKRDVWSARAEGFAATERLWYACTEGHPLTVATDYECLGRCPECLAPVAVGEPRVDLMD